MTTPSPTVQKIVRATRLDEVGQPPEERDPLTQAYIIFKELGVMLRDALETHSTTHEERQELSQMILAARTKLEQLMDEYERGSRHDGEWFLNKSKEWADQLATLDFRGLQ